MMRSFGTSLFGGYFNKFGGMGLLLAAALVPGQLMAQAACNVQFEAEALGGPVQYINEPVTIELEMGAGIVLEQDGVTPGYLDITQFEYDMDCVYDENNPATWPNCTPAGNTVEFADNVWTDCTNAEVGGDVVTLSPSVADETVVFTIDSGTPDPDVIRNSSEETCLVRFDIVVTAIEGDNLERQIYELTGIAGTGEGAATCSNGLPAGNGSSVLFDLSAVATRFFVTKEFSDDNPAPVDVHLRCDTGLPLEQSFTIDKDSTVAFTVKSYEPGELDCQVWEEPIPGGYEPEYLAGATTGVTVPEGGISEDENGCYYEGVINGDFTCAITNNAEPAKFTVNKLWEFSNSESGDLETTDVSVSIYCDNEILDALAIDEGEFWSLTFDLGDGESKTVDVDTSEDAATCWASENAVDSTFESTDDCGPRSIPAGGHSECTITNAVFFEGIPTLSRTGLALLVLMMLGAGLVGFRKFV